MSIIYSFFEQGHNLYQHIDTMAQQQKIELQDLDLQQLVEVKKQLEEVRILPFLFPFFTFHDAHDNEQESSNRGTLFSRQS
jgi:hypothetical protein